MTLTRTLTALPKKCSPVLHQSRTISSIHRHYRFHVGASWAGKPPDPSSRRLKTKPFQPDSEIGSHVGEDFFYVQDMRERSGVSFGVADGVGGWVDSGVDPSLFSQALMFHARRYSKAAWAGEPEIDPTQDYEERELVEGWEITPAECLELAHGGVLRERAVQAGEGSSTCSPILTKSRVGCRLKYRLSPYTERIIWRPSSRKASLTIYTIFTESDAHLHSLGDSGFSIIRSSAVIYQQRVQQHFFNCPKQLSKLPTSVPRFSRACIDSPRDAETYETKLRDGDIIIAYTDGLSDNVFPSEMIQICSLIARQSTLESAVTDENRVLLDSSEGRQIVQEHIDDVLVQTIAERTVDYARLCMGNKTRVSPFERAAAREGMYFRGGKVDDVTVVVALVREI
ncbi:uncharacterized protein FIBRA_01127 [Fibroporia radiculosa]|uniref:Protein phosphatase n=1 Tax=Fibroporia radiculosa TaxID=599839 RepID=J4G0T3_9APHY|nr:uncharacterized protein FIBRA_01127 [Fibroporia radiculosa]CCL99113.1 predicted protein [Fibroporia radiculosa]